MNTKKLALAITSVLLASISVGEAFADNTASAEAVAQISNFQIFKYAVQPTFLNASIATSAGTVGAQLAYSELKATSGTNPPLITSTQQNGASVTGFASDLPNAISSSTGTNLAQNASAGSIPSDIQTQLTGNTAAAVPTFNPAVDFPTVDNYAASMSNETGAPVTGFNAAAGSATLNSASYAGLSDTSGIASTSTNNVLTTSVKLNGISGSLNFNLDLSYYVQTYLSATNLISATASTTVFFQILDNTTGIFVNLFNSTPILPGTFFGNNQVNNIYQSTALVPGSGIVANISSALTNINFFTGSLVSTDNYTLTAKFLTDARVQLERTVPEPTSLALLGIGLLGFAASSRKSKNSLTVAA